MLSIKYLGTLILILLLCACSTIRCSSPTVIESSRTTDIGTDNIQHAESR